MDPGVDRSVVLRRLAAQRLTARDGGTPVDVVRHLLAVQAQDLRGARLAVRSRTRGLLAADVDAAFDDRRIVVAWLNRGTLHLVTAEDYWWLQPLTTPQLATSNRRRLQQEGVSPEQAEVGVEVVRRTLVDDGPTSRERLRSLLDEAGVPTARQAFVHVLFAAALQGHLIRGPVLPGGEQAFVDPRSWLGPPPDPLNETEALARLARRYLAAHGPALVSDLAYWAGTTLGKARRGVEAAGCPVGDDGLARLPDDEGPDGEGPHARLGPPEPVLLGMFDPLLHGWASREPILGRHQGIVTPNGLFKASALVDGRAVGIWTLPGGRVTLVPLEPVSDDVLAALAEDARDVQRYLGGAERPMEVVGSVPS